MYAPIDTYCCMVMHFDFRLLIYMYIYSTLQIQIDTQYF